MLKRIQYRKSRLRLLAAACVAQVDMIAADVRSALRIEADPVDQLAFSTGTNPNGADGAGNLFRSDGNEGNDEGVMAMLFGGGVRRDGNDGPKAVFSNGEGNSMFRNVIGGSLFDGVARVCSPFVGNNAGHRATKNTPATFGHADTPAGTFAGHHNAEMIDPGCATDRAAA